MGLSIQTDITTGKILRLMDECRVSGPDEIEEELLYVTSP